MPDVAKKVTLDLDQRKLFVDGEEFPWSIGESGPEFTGNPAKDRICTVNVPILAESIEVIPAKDEV